MISGILGAVYFLRGEESRWKSGVRRNSGVQVEPRPIMEYK